MRETGNHRATGAGLLFLAAMSGAAGWSLGAFGPDPRGPPGPAGATTGGGAPLQAPYPVHVARLPSPGRY